MSNPILIDFVTEFYKKYGNNENIIFSIDYMPENGADLVAYDVSEMIERPKSAEEFHSIISENGLDESSFEYDRVSIILVDN